jgi:hypothetical protein
VRLLMVVSRLFPKSHGGRLMREVVTARRFGRIKKR